MGSPVNVLVVDDDPNVGKILHRLVQRAGAQATVATDIQSARNELRGRSFGCAIVDRMLPDGDGANLIREIRQEQPGTDVVVITGDTRSESVVQALRLGAIDYIVKPFEIEAVIHRLGLILERRAAVAEASRMQQLLERGEAFRALLASLTADPPESEILGLAATWAQRIAGADGAAAVRSDGSTIEYVTALGIASPLLGHRVSPDSGFVGRALRRNHTSVFRTDRPKDAARALPEDQGFQAAVFSPFGAGGRPIGGLMVMWSRARRVPMQRLRVISGLAKSVSLGMTLLQAAELRRRFVHEVVLAQEAERTRISRELHDETGQSLTALLVRLRTLDELMPQPEAAGQIAAVRDVVARAMEDVKRLARGLRPAPLDTVGLEGAVRRYVHEYTATYPVRVDLHADGFDPAARLAPDVETAAYRIVQEALVNVARHSAATEVSLVLEQHPSNVRLIVEDNGTGFDVSSAKGLGLHGIRERVSLLHGKIQIESTEGMGTSLFVELPL